MRIAAYEPRSVVVSKTLHHQRVSVPVAHRITHPARTGIGLQGPPVHVDLTEGQIIVEDGDHRGSLKEPLHTSEGAVDRTLRQTSVMRVVPAEVLGALLDQLLRPLLNVGGPEIPETAFSYIAACPNRFPQTRQVGVAIGGTGRRGGEVRFSIGDARDAGRAILRPLRCKRRPE